MIFFSYILFSNSLYISRFEQIISFKTMTLKLRSRHLQLYLFNKHNILELNEKMPFYLTYKHFIIAFNEFYEAFQLAIKGSNNMFLKRTQFYLCPIKTDLEAHEGFPVKTIMKADRKLTVVCCQIFYQRSTAPSSSRFQRRPEPPPQAC